MRNRLTYANVVATLALVFAMSGGALAANHYLLNSTKQISPSLLKKLKGRAGAAGAAGKTGATGPAGASGSQGLSGKEGPPGPAGTAVAFAHITGDSGGGTILDAANSKNVSSVVEGQPGLYCFVTTVPVKNAVGSVDVGAVSKNPQFVEPNFSLVPLAIALKACPAGTNALVETPNTSGTTEKADFWISFN